MSDLSLGGEDDGGYSRHQVNSNTALLDRLYTDIEWARSQGLPANDVLPLLNRLVREAGPETQHGAYARISLAEALVSTDPFRAARLASEVLTAQDEERAHAVLALAHQCLGNFGLAEASYRRALQHTPSCPWHLHNLGHLLDVAFDDPHAALPLLQQAANALPDEPEVATSLAHALARLGQREEAKSLLRVALSGDENRCEMLLTRWQPRL